MSIKVILADDRTIIRKKLALLIDAEGDMEVVGEAEDGLTAVSRAKEMLPDVVIIDINMPGLNGLEATLRIVADLPAVKVLAVSMSSEKQLVTAMLRAGAFGYVLKEHADHELATAIRQAVAGRKYLSPGLKMASPS
ncbi:MAG: response regulator transcription factor [Candidatus Sulfobium sp.]|jgi:two-component system, NarL family, response regulator NreC